MVIAAMGMLLTGPGTQGDLNMQHALATESVSLEFLPRYELEVMRAAGEEILECYRVLEKTQTNIVAEVLAGQGTFYEYDHYPKGDVYDNETHAQYYYHAHRTDSGEHGHFHTFIRKKGIPRGIDPTACAPDKASDEDDIVCHLIAISMDSFGFPISLFTTNRWVTDESWYVADDVSRLLDLFVVDHTYPNWAVNRWVSAVIRLFKPQIRSLINDRDARIGQWRAANPKSDVYEDRNLEITSSVSISVETQISAVSEALG